MKRAIAAKRSLLLFVLILSLTGCRACGDKGYHAYPTAPAPADSSSCDGHHHGHRH